MTYTEARVFGPAFREPGSDQPPDPKLALRQSVLDVVTGHIGDLSSKLGVEDKSRLDQHLTGIRRLYMDDNQLTELSSTCFTLTRLSELRVAHNKLPLIPNCIGKLQDLQLLDLSRNQLTTLPSSLRKVSRAHLLTVAALLCI